MNEQKQKETLCFTSRFVKCYVLGVNFVGKVYLGDTNEVELSLNLAVIRYMKNIWFKNMF